ncbi:glucose-1-phosphate cytidylyltransferase [Gymnodinialimonas sp.]
MKVVILCGGYGTRIRGVADDVPKPMVEIGGRPMLWHIMKYFASYGHTDFVLCTGYKSYVIKDYFLNYDHQFSNISLTIGDGQAPKIDYLHDEAGWNLQIIDTGTETMTGGRIARIKQFVAGEESFFLTYGDGLSDVDLDSLRDFHASHGKALTVTGVSPPGRFGEIVSTEGGRVTGFNEKPQVSGGRISGGFFVASQAMFDHLSGEDDEVFEDQPMDRLVQAEELVMYDHAGFWQCMDTYRDWKLMQGLIDSDKAAWKRW